MRLILTFLHKYKIFFRFFAFNIANLAKPCYNKYNILCIMLPKKFPIKGNIDLSLVNNILSY